MSQLSESTLGDRVRLLSRVVRGPDHNEDHWYAYQKFLNLAFGPPIESYYDLTLGPASRQPLTWTQEYFLQSLPGLLEEEYLPERVLGLAFFFGYPFALGETCLIPRPDSEILVAEALSFLKEKIQETLRKMPPISHRHIFPSSLPHSPIQKQSLRIRILDACVGSGCLGISLVKALRDWIYAKVGDMSFMPLSFQLELWGFDVDPKCLSYAKDNAAYLFAFLDSEEVSQHAEVTVEIKSQFFLGDLFHPEAILAQLASEEEEVEAFDVFLANPPYISQEDLDAHSEVLQNDPRSALEADEEGLACYPPLFNLANSLVGQPGIALLEHGWTQASQVLRIARDHWDDQAGSQFVCLQDLGARDRALAIRRKAIV